MQRKHLAGIASTEQYAFAEDDNISGLRQLRNVLRFEHCDTFLNSGARGVIVDWHRGVVLICGVATVGVLRPVLEPFMGRNSGHVYNPTCES